MEADKPETSSAGESVEPARIDLSHASRHVRPPQRPYGAKPLFKTPNPFFGVSPGLGKDGKGKESPGKESRGKNMSERFTSDRMAAFTPQIAKRVADIPNLATVRGGDGDMDGKRLVIGKQIKMSGEISGCEKLVVEGKVDVTLSDVKAVEVTVNGIFKGNAEVESAIIAGTFEGHLKVSGHLEITPSGVVKGGVSYKTIAVANGGKILGSIETLDA